MRSEVTSLCTRIEKQHETFKPIALLKTEFDVQESIDLGDELILLQQ